eukprot:SAG25_NODE_3016_length_1267_cov_1.040240_2_plen_141_part_00
MVAGAVCDSAAKTLSVRSLPLPLLPQKMAMLGDVHTMPFSVTAGTSWSFFSLFSMCGTSVLIYFSQHVFPVIGTDYWKGGSRVIGSGRKADHGSSSTVVSLSDDVRPRVHAHLSVSSIELLDHHRGVTRAQVVSLLVGTV